MNSGSKTIKSGDFVIYTEREIGLVKSINEKKRLSYVWFHKGGTASSVNIEDIRFYTEKDKDKIINGDVIKSLLKRQEMLKNGEDVSDYID